MSKANCEFIIEHGLEASNHICRKAFANNLSFTVNGSNNQYRLKERTINRSSGNPTTSIITLEALNTNATKISITTSNFGILQTKLCNEIMNTVQNIIISESENRNNNTITVNSNEVSTIEKIKQLSELKDNGILTHEEFELKKSELLSEI